MVANFGRYSLRVSHSIRVVWEPVLAKLNCKRTKHRVGIVTGAETFSETPSQRSNTQIELGRVADGYGNPFADSKLTKLDDRPPADQPTIQQGR